MIGSVALVLLLAAEPATTTLPRLPEAPRDRAEQNEGRDPPGAVTDYLFNKELSATDDPAFLVNAIVGARQGAMDARHAGGVLQSGPLRAAAQKIGQQNEATTRALEALARKKGWRIPERTAKNGSSATHAPTRAGADFIINQIAYHQATLDQFRAQLAGKGDKELKGALRAALPGYQRNLELLLNVKP